MKRHHSDRFDRAALGTCMACERRLKIATGWCLMCSDNSLSIQKTQIQQIKTCVFICTYIQLQKAKAQLNGLSTMMLILCYLTSQYAWWWWGGLIPIQQCQTIEQNDTPFLNSSLSSVCPAVIQTTGNEISSVAKELDRLSLIE